MPDVTVLKKKVLNVIINVFQEGMQQNTSYVYTYINHTWQVNKHHPLQPRAFYI